MYKDKEQARETLLNKKLKTMFTEDMVEMNILMRELEGDKKPYEQVPQIKVHIA